MGGELSFRMKADPDFKGLITELLGDGRQRFCLLDRPHRHLIIKSVARLFFKPGFLNLPISFYNDDNDCFKIRLSFGEVLRKRPLLLNLRPDPIVVFA